MSAHIGRPFTGRLHSANASAGVEVPIREDGATAAYTLKAHEYLEVTDVTIVSVAGGDVFAHFGAAADTTPTDPVTIIRGTVAANGGVARGSDFKHIGANGALVFAVAPNGVVDVAIQGVIRNGSREVADRPAYREAL